MRTRFGHSSLAYRNARRPRVRACRAFRPRARLRTHTGSARAALWTFQDGGAEHRGDDLRRLRLIVQDAGGLEKEAVHHFAAGSSA
jgi:hypothetical protein